MKVSFLDSCKSLVDGLESLIPGRKNVIVSDLPLGKYGDVKCIDSRENVRLKPFKKKHGFCHRLLEFIFQLNQPMFTGNTPRNTACGAVLLKSVHLFGGSYTMVVPFIRASTAHVPVKSEIW